PLLFTDNETNATRLFDAENAGPFVKDAFHNYVVRGQAGAVNAKRIGTKVAAHRVLDLAPGETAVMRLRLSAEAEAPGRPFGEGFAQVFAARRAEAEEFYTSVLPEGVGTEERNVARQ